MPFSTGQFTVLPCWTTFYLDVIPNLEKSFLNRSRELLHIFPCSDCSTWATTFARRHSLVLHSLSSLTHTAPERVAGRLLDSEYVSVRFLETRTSAGHGSR